MHCLRFVYDPDEKQFWLVAKILDHRKRNGKIYYLVRWADYAGAESFDEYEFKYHVKQDNNACWNSTVETASMFGGCQQLLEKYHEDNGLGKFKLPAKVLVEGKEPPLPHEIPRLMPRHTKKTIKNWKNDNK